MSKAKVQGLQATQLTGRIPALCSYCRVRFLFRGTVLQFPVREDTCCAASNPFPCHQGSCGENKVRGNVRLLRTTTDPSRGPNDLWGWLGWAVHRRCMSCMVQYVHIDTVSPARSGLIPDNTWVSTGRLLSTAKYLFPFTEGIYLLMFLAPHPMHSLQPEIRCRFRLTMH